MTLSPMASSVAGSHTWSDVTGSGSEAILSTVAVAGDGSSVAAGSGSPSPVGSGLCSALWGDGRLGSRSGVRLVSSSAMKRIMINSL